MQVNIIHLPHREDRLKSSLKELESQNITDFKFWDGIVDPHNIPRGISQAHKQIVRSAKNEGLKEVLIAEDDLKFTACGAFDFFIKNKPPDFDLYLASIYCGEIDKNNTVNDFSGLTFYIIAENFYNTFLNIPEYNNIDRLLNGKGKFIVCNPFTVIQSDGYSDNMKAYCDNQFFFNKFKLFKN